MTDGETPRLIREVDVSDNPQETVRELQELVIAYAKQETLEPLKGLGKFAGWRIAAAVLLGLGFAFAEIGLLRVLQEETGTALTGNWSWVPYAATIGVAAIFVAIFGFLARRRTK
jgi:hypothetical protein